MTYVDVPSAKDVKSGLQGSVAAPLLHGEFTYLHFVFHD